MFSIKEWFGERKKNTIAYHYYMPLELFSFSP
jgi:hypothetical protein